MNSDKANKQTEIVINIKEIMWDLLEQWKAVLITAFLAALLVSGAKYAKDMNDYRSAQAAKEAEKQSAVSSEEKIADIIESLPEDERSTVRTVINQKEWVEAQKEYVNNSILLNTNPTKQRTLVVDYYITTENDSDTIRSSLIYGYGALLNNKEIIKNIGKTIDPDAEVSYIAELISVENSGNEKSTQNADAILEVHVVLPENVDSEKVGAVITDELKGFSSILSDKIGPHNLSVLDISEIYLYNSIAVKNRTDILDDVYDLQNNTKNIQTSLSDGQKAAIEAITAIKTAEETPAGADNNENKTDEPAAKPGFSKKYALLGFAIGVLMYAFIYLLIVIRRGCLLCAGDASIYTDTRLLGELYEQTKAKGIKSLLTSRLVQNWRYGSRLNTLKQTEKMSSSIEAVCRHEGIKELTLFDLSGSETMKALIKKDIEKLGIKVSEVAAVEDIDENELCDVANAVFLTGNTTEVSALCGLTELMKDYDINAIGSIYTARL